MNSSYYTPTLEHILLLICFLRRTCYDDSENLWFNGLLRKIQEIFVETFFRVVYKFPEMYLL